MLDKCTFTCTCYNVIIQKIYIKLYLSFRPLLALVSTFLLTLVRIFCSSNHCLKKDVNHYYPAWIDTCTVCVVITASLYYNKKKNMRTSEKIHASYSNTPLATMNIHVQAIYFFSRPNNIVNIVNLLRCLKTTTCGCTMYIYMYTSWGKIENFSSSYFLFCCQMTSC